MSCAQTFPRVNHGHRASNFLLWPPAGTTRPSNWEGEPRDAGSTQTLRRLPPPQIPPTSSSQARSATANPAPAPSRQPYASRSPSSVWQAADPNAELRSLMTGSVGRARRARATGVRGSGRGSRGERFLWVSIKEIMAAVVRAAGTAPLGGQGVKHIPEKRSRETAEGRTPGSSPKHAPTPASKPLPIG